MEIGRMKVPLVELALRFTWKEGICEFSTAFMSAKGACFSVSELMTSTGTGELSWVRASPRVPVTTTASVCDVADCAQAVAEANASMEAARPRVTRIRINTPL